MEKITTERLFESKIISLRTYNVCDHCRLYLLSDILEHYKKYDSFLTLRNCGKKVNDELINLCCKYKKLIHNKIEVPNNIEINKNTALENYINAVMKNEKPVLTNAQKNIINFQILVWAKLLSKRAYNALFYLLNGNFSIDNMYEIILSNAYFNFNKVRNVGPHTIPELNKFMSNIRTYISILSIISNDRIDLSDNKSKEIENVTIKIYEAFLYNEFKISDDHLDEIRRIYNHTGNVPIFKILDIIINREYLFSSSEVLIFNNLLNYIKDSCFSFSEIAETTKYSIEKINNEKIRLSKEFDDIFRFITIFDFSDLYGLDLKNKIISISKSDVLRINRLEKVNFSKYFYIKILSLFTRSTHIIIEFSETDSSSITNELPDDREQYLIDLSMTSVFNFNQFTNDFYKMTVSIRKKARSNLKNFITRYFYTQDYPDFDNILQICNLITKKKTNRKMKTYSVNKI